MMAPSSIDLRRGEVTLLAGAPAVEGLAKDAGVRVSNDLAASVIPPVVALTCRCMGAFYFFADLFDTRP